MSKHSKAEELTQARVASIKHATSFKLSATALDILAELAIKRGIAKSAVIENLLRDAMRQPPQRTSTG